MEQVRNRMMGLLQDEHIPVDRAEGMVKMLTSAWKETVFQLQQLSDKELQGQQRSPDDYARVLSLQSQVDAVTADNSRLKASLREKEDMIADLSQNGEGNVAKLEQENAKLKEAVSVMKSNLILYKKKLVKLNRMVNERGDSISEALNLLSEEKKQSAKKIAELETQLHEKDGDIDALQKRIRLLSTGSPTHCSKHRSRLQASPQEADLSSEASYEPAENAFTRTSSPSLATTASSSSPSETHPTDSSKPPQPAISRSNHQHSFSSGTKTPQLPPSSKQYNSLPSPLTSSKSAANLDARNHRQRQSPSQLSTPPVGLSRSRSPSNDAPANPSDPKRHSWTDT